MAQSVPFNGHDHLYLSPMNDPEADIFTGEDPIFAYQGDALTFSCWQLTPAEIDEVNQTGQIWLAVKNGPDAMRPTWIGSYGSIKYQCVDYGGLWTPRELPPADSAAA